MRICQAPSQIGDTPFALNLFCSLSLFLMVMFQFNDWYLGRFVFGSYKNLLIAVKLFKS